jgi:hypothetical protein
MENKFFDFEKAKTQVITLDQLSRTHKENDIYDQPLKGVYHFALIQEILGMCEEQNFHAEVYDMFAAHNKDRNQPGVVLLPQIEQKYGQRAVEAHILRRVFANIRLTDFDDDENTTNLAIAFHQKGIQVGFGNMVKICHNQCMLGADNYVATYGERGTGRGNGTSLPEMLEIVKSWLVDARHIIVRDRERMARMKEVVLTAEQILTTIGMLTAIRVKCDTPNKDIREARVYPLNQSQISKFTESLLIKQHHNGQITLWDLYNSATDLYKADAMEIPNLLPQNRAMVAFLEEQFAA